MYLGALGLAGFSKDGQPVSEATCGDTLTFDVPGSPAKIWLTQTQNGLTQFDGPYNLPMPPYMLDCARDVGTFAGRAYALNADGSKGNLLSNWSFVVHPKSAPAPVIIQPSTGDGPTTETIKIPGRTIAPTPTPLQPIVISAPGATQYLPAPAPTPAPGSSTDGAPPAAGGGMEILLIGGAIAAAVFFFSRR